MATEKPMKWKVMRPSAATQQDREVARFATKAAAKAYIRDQRTNWPHHIEPIAPAPAKKPAKKRSAP